MLEIFSSVAFGAIGYLIVTFALRPILRYLDLKQAITADLILYANSLPQTVTPNEQLRTAKDAYRRRAADLTSIGFSLPRWFIWYLSCRDEDPFEAASHLIGMSNANELNSFDKHRDVVRSRLRLPKVA